MHELLELILDLAINVLSALAEVWLGDTSWPDTWASRIFWGVVLLLLGGVIWRELR